MPKISVIVPVYNTEKHLKKCIESILNQTYQDFEIIIVNDGSTDNSQEIIDLYNKQFPQKIKSFIKPNGGLSDARNFGITKATGEYICFIDSDDYISLDLLESLKDEINKKTDLIKFKTIKVDTHGNEIEKINGPIFIQKSGQEAFNLLVFKDVLIEPAWLYLYKKDIIDENNFRFAINRYHEDFGLTPQIIIKSNTVSSLNVYGYYYVQSENSITRNNEYKKTIKSAEDYLFHYDNIVEYIKKIEMSKKTQNNLLQYYTNSILLKAKELKDIERKKYIIELKKRKIQKNIKVKNLRQFIKKIILILNINWYLNIK